MNHATKVMRLMALLCAAGAAVAQQQPPPAATPPAAEPPAAAKPDAAKPDAAKPSRATAQSEAGDPRADTSKEPAAPPPNGAPASSAAHEPAAKASAGRVPPGSSSAEKAPRTDRLDLGTATVTGDREQPKVMYIVPWKRSDIGDLTGKPMNSLVDEILAPVDRDVFKREVVYYHAVQADASQNGAQSKPGQQGEK
jgi:hypothetical protein